MNNLRKTVEKINIAGTVSFDEPLASHTTYRVGGPADVFVRPSNPRDIIAVLALARQEEIPVFVLGGGANILVSDRGIRGIVIDMTSLDSVVIENDTMVVEAGCPISEVSWLAAAKGLGGLAFIFSMPGSVGGAVWMNARCYGYSISDIIEWVEIIDEELRAVRIVPCPGDFAYKRSPFQKRSAVIVKVKLNLFPADRQLLYREMETNRADRERKGHFAAPSAGSVFKNNRAFGDPSGKIIDRLGLRGYRVGGAQVSTHHANMVINTGGATASDIETVIRHVACTVERELGIKLEREVIPIGDW